MQQEKERQGGHHAARAWILAPIKGLWGGRVRRPTNWETYPEMTRSVEQASEHSAVWLEVDMA